MGGIYGSLFYWLFQPEVWIILGILLAGAELVTGVMVALPLGVASFLTAALIYAQENLWFGDFVFFETWRGVLFAFAILSVISIGILKYVFQTQVKKKQKDISDY